MPVYRFKNCLLNTIERRVIKNEEYLDLTPKSFDVLQLLVERAGEIVTKDELLGKVWPGSFVEEGNLPVHISKLRRSLGETKVERFIETAQGSGYRFISAVHAVAEDEWQTKLKRNGFVKTQTASLSLFVPSIAVLPLRNESNDPEIDYLIDGLTEGLINSLSCVAGFKVIARDTVFLYKGKDFDVKEIGETLGVSTVLTGRARALNDTLTIGAELIHIVDKTQIWGAHYHRKLSDIVEIKDEITSVVCEKLRPETRNQSAHAVAKLSTQDFESYRLYLKGKYFLEKRSEASLYKAIECFKESPSHDPDNFLSYVEMVECYLYLYNSDYSSRTNALNNVRPLLALIPESCHSTDAVQTMFGGISLYFDWKFKESEEHLSNALKINPSSIMARTRYSVLLGLTGKFPEALSELHQLRQIDPLSLQFHKYIARTLYMTGHNENAVTYLNECLELAPTDYEAFAILGSVLTDLGDFDQALNALQSSLDIYFNVDTLAMMGCTNARAGRREKAWKILEQLESQPEGIRKHAIKLARIYLDLGEKTKAYECLEIAFHEHEPDLIALRCDPRWRPLRHETRFKQFLSRIGLLLDY